MPATAKFQSVPNPFVGQAIAFDVIGIAPAGYPCLLIAGDLPLSEAIAAQEQFTSVDSRIVPVLAIHDAEFGVLPYWEPDAVTVVEDSETVGQEVQVAERFDVDAEPPQPEPAPRVRLYEVEHCSRETGNHIVEEIQGRASAYRLAELREPESRGRVIIRRKPKPSWRAFGLDITTGEFMQLPLRATKAEAADFWELWDARRHQLIPVLWPEWAAAPKFELPEAASPIDATEPSDDLRIYEVEHCNPDTFDQVTEEVSGIEMACKLAAIRDGESLAPVTIQRKQLPEWRVIWIDLENGEVTSNTKQFTKKDVLGIWLDCKPRTERLACVPWPTWAPMPKIEFAVGTAVELDGRLHEPAAV